MQQNEEDMMQKISNLETKSAQNEKELIYLRNHNQGIEI